MQPGNRAIAAVLLCVLLAACQTQGTYVEQEEVDSIRDQVTTAEQLYEALGAPSVTIPKGNGKALWVYEGVHTTPGVTQFIPYLSIAIGRDNQKCTKLSVTVDQETGLVEQWDYLIEEDSDHWTQRDESCEAD